MFVDGIEKKFHNQEVENEVNTQVWKVVSFEGW